MKRLGILLSILIVTVVLMSSCKSTEPCPAYGQNDKVEQKTKI